jgi:hypothetical protein
MVGADFIPPFVLGEMSHLAKFQRKSMRVLEQKSDSAAVLKQFFLHTNPALLFRIYSQDQQCITFAR